MFMNYYYHGFPLGPLIVFREITRKLRASEDGSD